jgi:lipopolysaccharide/colanic/teichoic acid biosynthesis glycosyltransferase
MSTSTKIQILLGDVAVLAISFFLTILISFPFSFNEMVISHIPPFFILYSLWVLILYIFNLYEPLFIRPGIKSVSQLGIAISSMGVVGFLLFYFVSWYGITPKTNLVINLIIFSILLFIWRRVFGHTIEKFTNKDKVVIFGEHTRNQELSKLLSTHPNSNLIFSGFAKNESELPPPPAFIIFIEQPKQEILQSIVYKKYKVTNAREIYEDYFYRVPVNFIDEYFISLIKINNNLLVNFFRRIIEISFGFCIIVITIPISLITLIAIFAEDRGPIFYTQKRTGIHGRTFNFYKFRSMNIDAEKNGAIWNTEEDTRVTHIGKIIRKLHIDEIPQMINIIKGDLAIVGPRPERPEFVEKLTQEIPLYNIRHVVKPGFTGWAQINFRYARSIRDSERKLEYDLYYLAHKNIFLDIGIILKTIQIIFTH